MKLFKLKNHVKVLLASLLTAVCIFSTTVFFYYQHVIGQNSVKINTSAQFIKDFPWDLEFLSRPPEVKWSDEAGKIKSLYYEGLPYQGKKTDVFAYYATPGSISGDLSKDRNLPSIVIVHGGGQFASKSVVTLWAQRGYAAFSMDLDGHGPDFVRLANGGGPPAEDYMSYDWNYHAVSKIILAHSLMLSFPEIDKNRTAITGFSVGGQLTCIVAGIDNRFNAAASVFGTGFIYKKGFFKEWYQTRLEPEEQRQWRDLLDPSNYLEHITCPFLYVGNPNDKFYPIDIFVESNKLLKEPFYQYIDPNFLHNVDGYGVYVLESFFDQYLKAGPSLPVLQQPERKGDKIYIRSSDLQENHPAFMYFTTGVEPSDSRKWQIYPAQIDQNGITADLPPDNTTAYFVNYLVDVHVMISSRVLMMNGSVLH